MSLYLDYAASSPIDSRVLQEMVRVYTETYGNADSRTHIYGNRAKETVEASRNTLAGILKVDKSEVIFTSGATESNNLSILGLMRHAKETGRNHFITTAIEHKSVLEPMKHLMENGCDVDFIRPNESGRICASDVLSRVTDKTLLVSVMHANSETGIIQPVTEIGEGLSNTKTYFHVDATQSFGKCNDELRSLRYDMMSFSGHKLGGPQGIGGLIVRRGANFKRPQLTPLTFGGPQERGLRPGTTPVALVAGIALAATLCEQEQDKKQVASLLIKSRFLHAIEGLNYQINGDPSYCLPGTINVSFTGVDAEGVFVALKDQYAFSNGSACTSSSFAPSYVLTAMGLNEDRIASALRLSWDGETNVDFTKFVNYIRTII